jgi:hypothetical protein
LSTSINQKEIEITKQRIEISNLSAIKVQLASSLEIANAECLNARRKQEVVPAQSHLPATQQQV